MIPAKIIPPSSSLRVVKTLVRLCEIKTLVDSVKKILSSLGLVFTKIKFTLDVLLFLKTSGHRLPLLYGLLLPYFLRISSRSLQGPVHCYAFAVASSACPLLVESLLPEPGDRRFSFYLSLALASASSCSM